MSDSAKMDNPVARLWMEIEDNLFPALRLDGWEKALYYHLLRHTRLLGRRRIDTSYTGLKRTSGMGVHVVQNRLRRLERKGCIRFHRQAYRGKVIEVRLPREISGCVIVPSLPENQLLNTMNCIRNPKLRRGIYLREEGRCFYCREKVRLQDAVLDHVIPTAEGGEHTYRNVVLACFRCNSRKGARPAKDFLFSLKDRGIISIGDVHSRLLAIRELQAGRLRPVLRAA